MRLGFTSLPSLQQQRDCQRAWYIYAEPLRSSCSTPSLIQRHANFPDALTDSFEGEDSHVRTCFDLLENSVAKYPDVRASYGLGLGSSRNDTQRDRPA